MSESCWIITAEGESKLYTNWTEVKKVLNTSQFAIYTGYSKLETAKAALAEMQTDTSEAEEEDFPEEKALAKYTIVQCYRTSRKTSAGKKKYYYGLGRIHSDGEYSIETGRLTTDPFLAQLEMLKLALKTKGNLVINLYSDYLYKIITTDLAVWAEAKWKDEIAHVDILKKCYKLIKSKDVKFNLLKLKTDLALRASQAARTLLDAEAANEVTTKCTCKFSMLLQELRKRSQRTLNKVACVHG